MNRFLFWTKRAVADEAAAITRRYLEGQGPAANERQGYSSFETGARVLAERTRTAPDDDEARFGEGMLRFARAVERYAQAQYRYGLRPPPNLRLPFLRFPLPENPLPLEISYEKQRATLQKFLDDLNAAEAVLGKMEGSEVKIVLDLNAIQFDLTGSGKPDAAGKLGAILASLSMVDAGAVPETGNFEVAFDKADALWLRGYCNLLAASLEFVLAHEWRSSFEIAAELFYPNVSPLPLMGKRQSSESRKTQFAVQRWQIGVFVAFVHSFVWNVAEPERMKRAHDHLKTVVTLSRESWKAILAETDDDREWIPGPHQNSGVLHIGPVTEEHVQGWFDALDQFEAVLDGRKLLPHWRFAGGVNLKRMFYEPRPFDLLLWTTGPAAAPYVEDGEALTWEIWDEWQRTFGGKFVRYAFWFN